MGDTSIFKRSKCRIAGLRNKICLYTPKMANLHATT